MNVATVKTTGSQHKMSSEIGGLVRRNIRDYMMYIALVIIMVFFNIQTSGAFLTAQNIENLINQAGYVAVLAIGMTIILILVQIDLSVGYVAGFAGAVAAILMSKYEMSEWLAIPIVMIIGLAIGAYQGWIVTKLKVPAFVTTLAGMFIFRGLLSLVLEGTGTISIRNEGFNALSNGCIPDPTSGNVFTIIIGIACTALLIMSMIRARKSKQKYQFKVSSKPIFIAEIVAIAVIIMVICFLLASNHGLPWTAVIVGTILLTYNYMLNKTKLGRHIYGIGGNAQAAELSGVNVERVQMFAFVSMGLLAAIAGILFSSRLQCAGPTAGTAFEMDAIASSYIGGVAVSGGIGKVTNTLIGTLVIMSLTNGMNLMSVDISYQYVVKGIIFIIAVAFDVRTRLVSK